jgi:hypothetical protein
MYYAGFFTCLKGLLLKENVKEVMGMNTVHIGCEVATVLTVEGVLLCENV